MPAHKLTHLDEDGNARMVDVGDKAVTLREAWARGRVRMSQVARDLLTSGANPKGDVLTVAKIAGIAAAKRTADWIPLAHPLALDVVEVTFVLVDDPPGVEIAAYVKCHGRTGAEMEAMTAVAAAALTVYDMCKAADRGMSILDIELLEKRGGKSGTYRRAKGAKRRPPGVTS